MIDKKEDFVVVHQLGKHFFKVKQSAEERLGKIICGYERNEKILYIVLQALEATISSKDRSFNNVPLTPPEDTVNEAHSQQVSN